MKAKPAAGTIMIGSAGSVNCCSSSSFSCAPVSVWTIRPLPNGCSANSWAKSSEPSERGTRSPRAPLTFIKAIWLPPRAAGLVQASWASAIISARRDAPCSSAVPLRPAFEVGDDALGHRAGRQPIPFDQCRHRRIGRPDRNHAGLATAPQAFSNGALWMTSNCARLPVSALLSGSKVRRMSVSIVP